MALATTIRMKFEPVCVQKFRGCQAPLAPVLTQALINNVILKRVIAVLKREDLYFPVVSLPVEKVSHFGENYGT